MAGFVAFPIVRDVEGGVNTGNPFSEMSFVEQSHFNKSNKIVTPIAHW